MSRGLLFGLGMFLVEDEALNTILGTAAPPRRYPLQAHARGLISHLILGVVTEAVLSALDQPKGQGSQHRRGDRDQMRSNVSGPSGMQMGGLVGDANRENLAGCSTAAPTGPVEKSFRTSNPASVQIAK